MMIKTAHWFFPNELVQVLHVVDELPSKRTRSCLLFEFKEFTAVLQLSLESLLSAGTHRAASLDNLSELQLKIHSLRAIRSFSLAFDNPAVLGPARTFSGPVAATATFYARHDRCQTLPVGCVMMLHERIQFRTDCCCGKEATLSLVCTA
jgi:hypothetical protein